MKKLAALLAGAMLMFTVSTNANALTLRLTEGAFTQDIAGVNGEVFFNGQFHDFLITFLGGNSSLPNNPDVNSLSITTLKVQNNTAASDKTLTIALTDVGYILNPVYAGANNALSDFGASGGNLTGTTIAHFNAYLDTNNGDFTTQTHLGGWSPNPLASSVTPVITPLTLTSAPFSMTEVISLTQSKNEGATFSSNVSVAPVPEPGTMVLLGAGMLGLAIFGKRRMNKEA